MTGDALNVGVWLHPCNSLGGMNSITKMDVHEYVLLGVSHCAQPSDVLWNLVLVFVSRCYRVYYICSERKRLSTYFLWVSCLPLPWDRACEADEGYAV